MQKYYNNVMSGSGTFLKSVQGASVLVTLASTGAIATIYSDNGITTTANPLTTDAYGQFSFYAADGRYNFAVTANGVNAYSFSDVLVDDPQPDLSYTDTGILGSWTSATAGYNQVVIQNTSNTATASANYIVANSATTATTGYAEFGINSASFAGTGSLSQPSYAYLATASTDLVVGTFGVNNIRFVVNNRATDALQITSTGQVVIAPSTATPAGGTAGLGLRLGSTSNLGVFFGSGVPTLAAAQGSLYLRTDGSTTTTRMYINTNGTTGWTNVVTSA